MRYEKRSPFFVGHLDRRRREDPGAVSLESFRLSQILSFGGLVVAEDSDGEDVASRTIRVEKKTTGRRSARSLVADGDALAAFKRRAFDLYRQRFAPGARPPALRRSAWSARRSGDRRFINF